MQVCSNPECKAKHYEFTLVCTNCNQDLPEVKSRKQHDVYCLVANRSVTTKKLSDKFLNEHADSQGFVELLKNSTEEIWFLRTNKGTFKQC